MKMFSEKYYLRVHSKMEARGRGKVFGIAESRSWPDEMAASADEFFSGHELAKLRTGKA